MGFHSPALSSTASGARRRTVVTILEEGSQNGQPRSAGDLSSPHLSSCLPAHASDRDRASDEEARAPEPETDTPSFRNAAISVAMIDEHSFTRESIARSLHDICKPLSITLFATSDQCLESPKNYDVILCHKHHISENHNSIDTIFAEVKKLSAIAPVILLCGVDSFELLRAAFDCGVRGYIPTASTTLEVTIEIIYLVKAGGIFVPPSSLSPRRSKLPAAYTPTTPQKFTPRQMAVLDRLKLGQSNKMIAFELNMSESSVKSHIQNLIRKMNATNRTEVACLAQKLEMNSFQMLG
jgi:DNA-binding NarL/FixJ family response regulator